MFEWDEAKSEANLAARGFDFAHAALVFDGPTLEWDDDRTDYGERRTLVIGRVDADILFVVFTWRDGIRRIISASLANRPVLPIGKSVIFMKKHTAEQARRKARVHRKTIDSTTESDITRHAAEDGSETENMDFKAALSAGQMRTMSPLDVAAVRAKTGLSQDRFARAFQISPHTLRNWEQGRRVPEGPARALLLAIDHDPEAVMRALAA